MKRIKIRRILTEKEKYFNASCIDLIVSKTNYKRIAGQYPGTFIPVGYVPNGKTSVFITSKEK